MHRGQGVALLGQTLEAELKETFKNGELCGKLDAPLIAQRYISNPLTLDKQNKFDIRMYLLIASVDPLIAFYHDGLLRVSLIPYQPANISQVRFLHRVCLYPFPCLLEGCAYHQHCL